jgi:hypothetical protein
MLGGEWTVQLEYPGPDARKTAYLAGFSQALTDLHALGITFDGTPCPRPLFRLGEKIMKTSRKHRQSLAVSTATVQAPVQAPAVATSSTDDPQAVPAPAVTVDEQEGDSGVEDGDSCCGHSDDEDGVGDGIDWCSFSDETLAMTLRPEEVDGENVALQHSVTIRDIMEAAETGSDKEIMMGNLIARMPEGDLGRALENEHAAEESHDTSVSVQVDCPVANVATLPEQPKHTIPLYGADGQFLAFKHISTLVAILNGGVKASADRAVRIHAASKKQRDAGKLLFADLFIEINSDIGCVFADSDDAGGMKVEYGWIERIGIRNGKKIRDVTVPISLQHRVPNVVIWCAWYEPVPADRLASEVVSAKRLEPGSELNAILGSIPPKSARFFRYGPHYLHESEHPHAVACLRVLRTLILLYNYLAVDLDAVIARVKVTRTTVLCEEPDSDLHLFQVDENDAAMCEAHVAGMMSESAAQAVSGASRSVPSTGSKAAKKTGVCPPAAADSAPTDDNSRVAGPKRSLGKRQTTRLQHYATP